jgi:hypothetical protein
MAFHDRLKEPYVRWQDDWRCRYDALVKETKRDMDLIVRVFMVGYILLRIYAWLGG